MKIKPIEWLQRKYIEIQLWCTMTVEHAIKMAQEDGLRTTQAYMNMLQTDHIAPAVQVDHISTFSGFEPIPADNVNPEWPYDVAGKVQSDIDSCRYNSIKVQMRDSLYNAMKDIKEIHSLRKSTRGQKLPILEFGFHCLKVTLRPNDNYMLGIELKSYGSPLICDWAKRAMIMSLLVPSKRSCYTTVVGGANIDVETLEVLIKNLIKSYADAVVKG